MLKFAVLALFVAVANAGLIAAPVGHGATSHSSIVSHASPVGYAAPQLSYGHAAPALSYAQPSLSIAHAAPVAHYAKAVVAEAYAPPHYDFEYSVHDPHTGDVKSQRESRQGDAVHGSYSLVEADGSRRIVEYTADAHNGFNAVVHREPAQHPVAVKAVAPVYQKAIVAAPAIGYASPIAHQISHHY